MDHYILTVLVTGVYCTALYVNAQLDTELHEYCQWETFNASCSAPDEVVLMTGARYGRMRFGRCMREDHGNVGCSAVVLPYVDRICSGRRSCQLSVPDATLHNIHPCPKELMPYLEASYSCVKVGSGSMQTCAQSGSHMVTTPQGYLASVTTAENGIGAAGCPWQLDATPGQRISLHLLSFTESRPRLANQCDWTVVVHEGNFTSESQGCNPGGMRDRLMYNSQTHSVRVQLQAVQGVDVLNAAQILIKYQMYGCADLNPVLNAQVVRHGDTTVVKCSYSGHTYIMTCVDDTWQGEHANCSKANPVELSQKEMRSNVFPYGLFLVIGIGVVMGIILGVLMLFAIIFCLRRHKAKRLRSQTTDPLLQDRTDGTDEQIVYAERKDRVPATLCPYHHHLRYHLSPSTCIPDQHLDCQLNCLTLPSPTSLPLQVDCTQLSPRYQTTRGLSGHFTGGCSIHNSSCGLERQMAPSAWSVGLCNALVHDETAFMTTFKTCSPTKCRGPELVEPVDLIKDSQRQVSPPHQSCGTELIPTVVS